MDWAGRRSRHRSVDPRALHRDETASKEASDQRRRPWPALSRRAMGF